MPPQPLLSVRRDAAVNVEPITLRQYPDLARSISDVIATWSQAECNLGVLLARMLGAAARPSMAMYSALSSSAAQMAALQAAADVALSRERLELFGALLILVKRAATKRNKIAHPCRSRTPSSYSTPMPSTDSILRTRNTWLRSKMVKQWRIHQRYLPSIYPRRLYIASRTSPKS
jgi:hypothetical protein